MERPASALVFYNGMMNKQDKRGNGPSIGMVAAGWILTICVITFGFQWYLDGLNNPNQNLTLSIDQQGPQEVILTQNRQGHYVAPGLINGHPVTFLVDTGATKVAIPGQLSRKLGLQRGAAMNSHTAGGVVTTYLTRLPSVQIGNLLETNVSGAIVPSMPGNEVLLGMSFLRHYTLQQQGNQLKIFKPAGY